MIDIKLISGITSVILAIIFWDNTEVVIFITDQNHRMKLSLFQQRSP